MWGWGYVVVWRRWSFLVIQGLEECFGEEWKNNGSVSVHFGEPSTVVG